MPARLTLCRQRRLNGQCCAREIDLGPLRHRVRGHRSSENLERVDAPKREIANPLRNDALLNDLTSKTDGDYFIGFDDATSSRTRPGLAKIIEPQDQLTVIPGTPDRNFDRQLMTWLMGMITGILCVEWLVRRLSKLA